MPIRVKPRRQRAGQGIYEGDKRASVIAATAEILTTATYSKFEFEASCRHALRHVLCLEGHRWPVADAEAEMIVSSALDTIGAVRPSWAMGQPEAIIPREDCQRCGAAIDAENYANGRRYCSDFCRDSAKLYRVQYFWRAQHIAEQKLTARAANTKHCLRCGDGFKPFKRGHGQDYCSRECARRARGDLKPPKACFHCGNEFTPPRPDSRFCSTACKTAGIAAEQPVKPCACCAVQFQPRTAVQIYCSPRCTKRAWEARQNAVQASPMA